MKISRHMAMTFLAGVTFFLPLLQSPWQWWTIGLLLLVLTLVRKKISTDVVGFMLIMVLLLHLQWGVAQYVKQGDLGFRYIGESVLAKDIPGVAKFGPEKTIRAYGLYDHANSYGGAMLVGAVLLAKILSRRKDILIGQIIMPLFFLGVLVSFSRSAFLGWLILMMVWWWKRQKTLRKSYWLVPLLVLVIFMPMLIDRYAEGNNQAWPERQQGYVWAGQIIRKNSPWRGTGIGNFKEELREYLNKNEIPYSEWQIDYVHCVPLQVIAWVGVVPALLLLFCFIWWAYLVVPKKKWWIFLPLLPLVGLDHFLLTQAGPMWLVINLILL